MTELVKHLKAEDPSRDKRVLYDGAVSRFSSPQPDTNRC